MIDGEHYEKRPLPGPLPEGEGERLVRRKVLPLTVSGSRAFDFDATRYQTRQGFSLTIG